MEQIDGFPVYTVNFENGQMNSETSLDSVNGEAIDETIFIPPPNYQRQKPFA